MRVQVAGTGWHTYSCWVLYTGKCHSWNCDLQGGQEVAVTLLHFAPLGKNCYTSSVSAQALLCSKHTVTCLCFSWQTFKYFWNNNITVVIAVSSHWPLGNAQKRVFQYCKARNSPVLGSTFPRWLNFVIWCLIFLGFQYGMCFMIPCWHLEFQGGSNIFQKFVDLWVRPL